MRWFAPRLARPLLLAVALCGMGTGCTMTEKILHEFKPHRLARWNRSPRLPMSHGMFSVPDDIAVDEAELDARENE